MKPSVCPECQGKGTVTVKTGMAVKRQKCPICWKGKI